MKTLIFLAIVVIGLGLLARYNDAFGNALQRVLDSKFGTHLAPTSATERQSSSPQARRQSAEAKGAEYDRAAESRAKLLQLQKIMFPDTNPRQAKKSLEGGAVKREDRFRNREETSPFDQPHAVQDQAEAK